MEMMDAGEEEAVSVIRCRAGDWRIRGGQETAAD